MEQPAPRPLVRELVALLLHHLTSSRAGVTVRVMNRTTAGLLVASAAIVVLGVVLRPDLPHRPLLVAYALAGLVLALAVRRLQERMDVWHFHITMALCTALIATGLRVVGPEHAGTDAWLLAVIAVESAFFFTAPAACAHLLLALGGLWVGLGAGGGADAGDLVVVASVLVVLAVLVRVLARATEAAGIDPLTRLPDRTSTSRRLEHLLAQAGRSGEPVSLALLGVDRFSAVNERQGHAAGDALLRTTAERWKALLPRGALLGRWGGDQFAVLLRADGAAAAHVVEQLRLVMPADLGCSGGVVTAVAGDTLADVVDHADGALVTAKRHRGTTHRWVAGTPTGSGLLAALESGAVEVHYQPVVSLPTGRTTGAEALVRWRRPDGSLIPPVDFLPQAEASGTVVQLGRYVLARACAEAATWPAEPGSPPLSVAVNASGAELAQPEYATWVLASLSRSGLAGPRLVIEVVEGLLDEESPVVIDNLHALRAAGVRLAVDDFGTGWSSLSRLARLPLDVLKIDRSFVAVVEPGLEAPVCAGVVALAQALDLEIIAEGVETEHQAAWLSDLGCQEAQGWLYAPALPSEAFRERLAAAAAASGAAPAVAAAASAAEGAAA